MYEIKVANETETYCGQWKQGVSHGHGLYIFSDQSLYMGAYKNDQKHGLGCFKQSDSETLKQVKFEFDQPIF
jgi:hypothetical protein